MIPLKIINREKAVELGLSEPIKNKPSGAGEIGGGSIVRVNKENGEQETIESFIIKGNDEKELTFIHEDRKNKLIKNKEFEKYLEQFTKVEGKERETYLKDNNIRVLESK